MHGRGSARHNKAGSASTSPKRRARVASPPRRRQETSHASPSSSPSRDDKSIATTATSSSSGGSSKQLGLVLPSRVLKRSASVQAIDELVLPNREVFRLGYQLIRRPFPVDDPILTQTHRHRRRFVCGHPGCGKAFTNQDLAIKHLRTHDFRCGRDRQIASGLPR